MISEPIISPSYCKINNFGDALNALIADEVFSKLLGTHFTNKPEASSTRLYAIGSYLSREFLESRGASQYAIIAGMGAGYVDFPVKQGFGFGPKFPVWIKNDMAIPLKKVSEAKTIGYRILFVRGPLTSRLLRLPYTIGFADAGYLLRVSSTFNKLQKLERSGVSFMPHYTSANGSPQLREICEAIGFKYIDPCSDVRKVLKEIAETEVLLTEALHGAVVSDALRVPWIPLKSSDDVFEFKWLDFMSSIGRRYDPLALRVRWKRAIYTGRRPLALLRYATTGMRSLLTRALVAQKDTALSLLKASAAPSILSDDLVLNRFDQVIAESLAALKSDCETDRIFAKESQ